MKAILFLSTIVITLPLFSYAQSQDQTPQHNEINTQLIKNTKEKMVWYTLSDTGKTEIAKIDTEISRNDHQVKVRTIVKMSGQPDWIDETVAELSGLKPVQHTSSNTQREMALYFGKTVTGHYTDKAGNTRTEINEKTEGSFFDSNIYPQIIRWLPLNDHYKTDIVIFDYNPKSGAGLMKAHIRDTQKGSYLGKNVWVLTVTDDITQNAATMTYYIDMESKDILKQEINMGPRKMVIEKVE